MGKSFFEQKCRVCGCDWNHACNDHDHWFAEDLCSVCAESMRPILFNTPMVRAILDGRKTTTRRIVKPQHKRNFIGTGIDGRPAECRMIDIDAQEIVRHAIPPFQTGDVLYVRETWGISNFDEDESTMTVQYKADDSVATVVLPPDKFQKYYDGVTGAEPDYRPSIHMPKEAARIFLRVTDVKAERLQDITEDGAKAEGAKEKRDFIRVWNDTIPDKNSQQLVWSANPWVWVISFERC